jgi:aspartate kinase
MLVFKFGGASVKDAAAVKNVADILSLYSTKKRLVVISAMGKSTNALETIALARWNNDLSSFRYKIDELYKYHLGIIDKLFYEKHIGLLQYLEITFNSLNDSFRKTLPANYDALYDDIVCIGELLSTRIVETYLLERGFASEWLDARNYIITDAHFRNANVHWDDTILAITSSFSTIFKHSECIVTQGYIAGSSSGVSTTLGREGSDYSAAIFAYALNAESVTIWKDVPGMLNADPKWFENTIKLNQISFQEAIELAYYGATVIHPKTIKPLQNKQIPLYVRSFVDPELDGTIISSSTEYDDLIPSFIFKMHQIMIQVTAKDFSFIAEHNLSQIFDVIAANGVQINMMQNSALSFDFVYDDHELITQCLRDSLELEYHVSFLKELELVTIRHYDDETIKRVTEGKKIILNQTSEQTARILMVHLD